MAGDWLSDHTTSPGLNKFCAGCFVVVTVFPSLISTNRLPPPPPPPPPPHYFAQREGFPSPVLQRSQELCEGRGSCPWLPVPNSPYGLCGRKATVSSNCHLHPWRFVPLHCAWLSNGERPPVLQSPRTWESSAAWSHHWSHGGPPRACSARRVSRAQSRQQSSVGAGVDQAGTAGHAGSLAKRAAALTYSSKSAASALRWTSILRWPIFKRRAIKI